jgi:hypothetical protein
LPANYFVYDTDEKLAVSIIREIDGMIFDFAAEAFTPMSATPAPTEQLTIPAFEGVGIFLGLYWINLPTLPAAQFLDGDYEFVIHDAVRLAAGQRSTLSTRKQPCHGLTFTTYFPAALAKNFTLTATG